MSDKKPVQAPVTKTRAAWQKPSLQRVGAVGDVFKGGGGKLSLTAHDTGDVRKPSGQG